MKTKILLAAGIASLFSLCSTTFSARPVGDLVLYILSSPEDLKLNLDQADRLLNLGEVITILADDIERTGSQKNSVKNLFDMYNNHDTDMYENVMKFHTMVTSLRDKSNVLLNNIPNYVDDDTREEMDYGSPENYFNRMKQIISTG
jgi:hypothetical protein